MDGIKFADKMLDDSDSEKYSIDEEFFRNPEQRQQGLHTSRLKRVIKFNLKEDKVKSLFI
jgi:hypothetical protein